MRNRDIELINHELRQKIKTLEKQNTSYKKTFQAILSDMNELTEYDEVYDRVYILIDR